MGLLWRDFTMVPPPGERVCVRSIDGWIYGAVRDSDGRWFETNVGLPLPIIPVAWAEFPLDDEVCDE